MRSKGIIFCVLLVIFAGLSGFLHREIYGLQHVSNQQWIKMATYVIAMPLAKLTILLPGLLVGYLNRHINLVVVFLVGMVGYFPYQYAASGNINLGVITLVAHSMAYSVAILVAYLGGAKLSEL